MLRYLIGVLLLGVVLGSKPYYDLADAERHFADFVEKYDRHYESVEEYNKRFEIFKNKLAKINYWNEIHEALFDVNQFADKDLSELNRGQPSLELDDSNSVTVKEEWIRNAPDSLDYRKQGLVTEVKNQGMCSDSYIFSAAGNIESQFAKLTGKLISLSEQQALDCIGHPCIQPGTEISAIRKLAKTDGLMAEADYPYKGEKGKCRTDKSKVKVKVTAADHINATTEEQLKGALVELGPLAIGMDFTESVLQYDGGVLKPTDCEGAAPNQALLLVGYSTDKDGTPYWIMKNSFSDHWGENGYIHLEMGKNHCSILLHGAANARVASP